MYNERSFLTSRHKMTSIDWDAVKDNQSINKQIKIIWHRVTIVNHQWQIELFTLADGLIAVTPALVLWME